MNAFRLSGAAARLAVVLVTLGACRESDEQVARVRDTEDSVRPFSPSYARDPARRHIVVFFRYANQQLTLDPTAPAIRPGNLPYRPTPGGGFRVAYLDANGSTLGTYTIEDPTTVRSCDVSDGRAGEVRTLPAARIEIIVPFDGRIAYVELASPALKTQRYDVRAALQRVMGGRQ